MDATIKLIAVTKTVDAIGVPSLTETPREVFCRVDSVTRREFFEAGRNGLNPEWRFTVFADDYGGEQTVDFEGKRYGVYRAYRLSDSDYMELYCEKKAGAAPKLSGNEVVAGGG